MPIIGVAMLAACTLAGLLAGDVIGASLGLKANVGGVGIAMLLLIAATSRWPQQFGPGSSGGQGVGFWNLMYIPIIVAMAARQNVMAAVSGGAMAVAAGAAAVAAGFALVPLLARLGRR